MAFVNIVVLLGFILILSLSVSSVHAENSWNVVLNPYDGDKKDELFTPLELPISLGDTVTWINQDSTNHKIVSGVPDHPDYSGEFFSSDILSPGDMFSETFDEDVQYTAYYYFCEIHPWFTGKLFFEDRDTILHSTLDISYDIIDSELLQISGLVESALSTTGYEVLIYDSKNDLVFHKLSSFESDASFDFSIDISDSIWSGNDDYLLKLVYGIPSESTELSFNLHPENSISNSNPSENVLEQMLSQVKDWMYSILGF